MKKIVLFVLFSTAYIGLSNAECRVYSLPAPCTLKVTNEKPKYFERAYVIAAVDSQNRLSPPFMIEGYGKKEWPAFCTEYGALAVVGKDPLDDYLIGKIRNSIPLEDELLIADRHYRLRAAKNGDAYIVTVENLDSLRANAELKKESDLYCAELMGAELAGPTEKDWPLMDGNRKRYCVCKTSIGSPRKSALSPATETLTLTGAMYQEGNEFSILFALTREKGDGAAENVAEGRAMGKIQDGQIKDGVITYEFGEDVVKSSIELPSRVDVLGRFPSGAGQKTFEEISAGDRFIRLKMVHGVTALDLDIRMKIDGASTSAVEL